MSKRKIRNTKGKIISAAWKLFYELGYENTTVDEIVEESETSKGSFYHYFKSKDDLLSSLSFLFDEKYQELEDHLPNNSTAINKLLFLNQELFSLIENTISVELLSRLFSSQLTTKSSRHLLDTDRTYYRLIRKILQEGQRNNEFSTAFTVNEMVKIYAMMERGLMYDWCLCNGDYSLAQYSRNILPLMLNSLK